MPASVSDGAKVAGIFVAPDIELDFQRNWVAWFEILVAVDMATAKSEVELHANGNDVGYDIGLGSNMETRFE